MLMKAWGVCKDWMDCIKNKKMQFPIETRHWTFALYFGYGMSPSSYDRVMKILARHT